MTSSQTLSATRVAVLALSPWHLPGMHASFSFAARRLQAALMSDPRLDGVEVRLFEHGSVPLETWMAALEDFGPDVVAASAYVWSMPTFALLAEQVKQRIPRAMVVFGGPSARPEMLDLAPFQPLAKHIDVMVVGEGEAAICDLVDSYPTVRTDLPGLVLPSAEGWRRTPPRKTPLAIDTLPSPYRMGLSPTQSTAYLENFRGCPMSCSFCQWGAMDPAGGVMSVESLVREFEALEALDPLGICLVDAGLNLNARSFRNLVEAEARTGFFKGRYLDTEIYPNVLKPEHLEFLGNARSNVGLGLQSMNAEALERVKRPFKRDRFADVVGDLASVAKVSVEIILGLPGDTPEGFKATIDYLRDLPCNIRIYYCLVLPDAFMTREKAEVRYHPITLELESGPGWSAEDLQATCEWLDSDTDAGVLRLNKLESGDSERLESYVERLVDPPWWVIRSDDDEEPLPTSPHAPQGDVHRVATPIEIHSPDLGEPLPPALRNRLAKAVELATRSRWALEDARRFETDVEITLRTGRRTMKLSVKTPGGPAFRLASGLAFSYISDEDEHLPPAETSMLELVIDLLARLLTGTLRPKTRNAPNPP